LRIFWRGAEMIIIGFVEVNSNTQALDLFNEIYTQRKLNLSKNIESKSDIISMGLNYSDFFAEKYKFINFDILVFQNCDIIKRNLKNSILSNISNKNILIVNLDNKDIFKSLDGLNARLITYGLNGKSCITASSIQNSENYIQQMQCCIQRTIPTFLGNKLEPQEFKIVLNQHKNNDVYIILAAVSAALICGVDIKKFKNMDL